MENGKNLIHSFNHSGDFQGNLKGLTKREYFAGLAMQGLLSHIGTASWTSSQIAKQAVEQSDAILKQLENE